MADCRSVCEHLHLPVQSGDDAVLRRMGRQYTIEHYLERLARIREAVPGIAISTDVIVGFCGETEAQFEATLRAARDRPLRPGLRGGLLAAARDARDAPRRRRPGRRQAAPAQRAAGAPGGDRARAQPGVARARGRGPRRRGRPAARPRPRRTTDDAGTTDAADAACPGRTPRQTSSSTSPVTPTSSAARSRSASTTPARTRCGARSSGRDATAPPLLVIAGATATGKTGLAIALAERRRGERASRRDHLGRLAPGLPRPRHRDRQGHGRRAGARPAPRPRPRRARTSRSRVADFAAHARTVLAELAAHGGVAILAGGTGLYLRAVARGIDTDALPTDPRSARRLEAELIDDGLEPLVARLQPIAPRRAATVDLAQPAPRRPRPRDRRARRRRAAARRRAATRARWPGSACTVDPDGPPRAGSRPGPGPSSTPG